MEKNIITNSDTAVREIAKRYPGAVPGGKRALCLFVDKDKAVLGGRHLATRRATAAAIRTAVRSGLLHKAAGIVWYNMAPGGNPVPSSEDIDEAIRLKTELKASGLSLVDYINVAGKKKFSFADERVTRMPKAEKAPGIRHPRLQHLNPIQYGENHYVCKDTKKRKPSNA